MNIANKILNLIGAKTYTSYTCTSVDDINLYYLSLQFHNGKYWIYDYSIYFRVKDENVIYPMYVCKVINYDDYDRVIICKKINNENELKEFGFDVVNNKQTNFKFNHTLHYDYHNLTNKERNELIKNNHNYVSYDYNYDGNLYFCVVK